MQYMKPKPNKMHTMNRCSLNNNGGLQGRGIENGEFKQAEKSQSGNEGTGHTTWWLPAQVEVVLECPG